MENTEFKAKFDNIQRLFDRCISHAYETLERNIYMKLGIEVMLVVIQMEFYMLLAVIKY